MSNRSAVYTASPSNTFAAILTDLGEPVRRSSHPGRGLTNSEQNELAREKAIKEGFDKGFQEGFAKGQEKGTKQAHTESRALLTKLVGEEVERFVAALQEKHDSVDEAVSVWCTTAEEQITDLAMDIVRKLVASELQTSRDSALAIAKQTLGEITHSTRARIRLNPFDSAILGQYKSALIASSASLRDVEIVEDESIYGGCIVETEGGVIDATIETGLELIQGSLGEAA